MASEVEIHAILQEKRLDVGVLLSGVLRGAVLSATCAVHWEVRGRDDPWCFAAVDRRQILGKPRQLEETAPTTLYQFPGVESSKPIAACWGPSLMT